MTTVQQTESGAGKGSIKSWKFSIHGIGSRVLLGSPVTGNRRQVRDKAAFWVKSFSKTKVTQVHGAHVYPGGRARS